MICAPSVGEEQTARFYKVYYAVRYILNEAKLKIGQFLYVPKKLSMFEKVYYDVRYIYIGGKLNKG